MPVQALVRCSRVTVSILNTGVVQKTLNLVNVQFSINKIINWNNKKQLKCLAALHSLHVDDSMQESGEKEYTIMPLESRVSALMTGLWSSVKGTSHTYTENKMRATRPLSASSIRLCKQDVGGLKASHGGRLSSAPLSLPSCPHPLCRRRNRRLSGPIQRRRSASYVIRLLNWSWAAELARALIRAAELKWPPRGTGYGSLGWKAAVKGSAWVGCTIVLRWMAPSLWMARR